VINFTEKMTRNPASSVALLVKQEAINVGNILKIINPI